MSLCNAVRARNVLENRGYDAFVSLQMVNVYYLTGYASRTMNARWDVAYAAVYPADPSRGVGLAVPAMELLFMADALPPVDHIVPYLAPMPGAAPLDEFSLPAVSFGGFPRRHDSIVTPVLQSKFDITARLGARTTANVAEALGRLLREAGLTRSRVVADDARAAAWIAEARLPSVSCDFDPSVIKEVRVVKTSDEIALLRHAARANESACRAVAAMVVGGTRSEELDQYFAVECARRGSTAAYLVSDLGELPYRAVERGEPLMLDALSHRRGYHGDFGRTLLVGEPSAEVLRRVAGLDAAWHAAREAIRPGADYESLKRAAAAGASSAGFTEFQPPTPHCLGLQHTDDPVPYGLHPGIKPNRTLEAGMVINLDMPFIEWGWGSLHREDTVLVTSDGCEVLTSDDTTLIVVE